MSTNHDSDEEYGYEAEAASVNAEKEAFKLQEEEFDHSDDLLGEFLDSASKEIDNIVFFPVTNRPGDWSLEFTAVVSESEIKRYDKGGRNGKSRNAKGGDQFSNAKMCATLIAEKCIGIYKGIGPDKKQVIDGDGDPLLLNSMNSFHPWGTRTMSCWRSASSCLMRVPRPWVARFFVKLAGRRI